MTDLFLDPGDKIVLHAREDIKAGDEIGVIKRPFNAGGGQWRLSGKFVTVKGVSGAEGARYQDTHREDRRPDRG